MKCPEIQQYLHQYADNTIDESIRHSVEAHLDECRSCLGEYNSLKALLGYLSTMPVPEISGQRWQEMNRKICSEIERISSSAGFQPKRFFSFPRPIIRKWAIAASLLLSAVSVTYFFAYKFSDRKFSPVQVSSSLKVVEIQGQVFAHQPSEADSQKPVDIRSSYLPGKTLSTAASSSLRLQTDEKSFLDIAEKTSLHINECTQAKQAFTLKQGTVTAHVNKRRSGQVYHIVTPNASCEVVGTRFNLSFEENADPRQRLTNLEVLEGKVLFRNSNGSSVLVDSGWSATAGHDTIIVQPPKPAGLSDKRAKANREMEGRSSAGGSRVNTDAVFTESAALINSGNLDEAISMLRKIHSDRTLPSAIRISALQKEARCWKMKKDYSQSIKTLQSVLERADSDDQKESALFQIASMYRSELHDFDAAAKKLTQYIAAYPKGIWAEEACFTLAELYQLQKDYRKSSELYLRFLSEYPNSIRTESVLYSLARIYSRDLQDCNRALNVYSQFESQFPGSNFAEDALFWKAECLFQLKRISESITEFRHYLSRYPNGKWITEAQIRSGYKATAGIDK